MYAYLKGILAEVGQDAIVLDVNQIGYRVFLPASSYRDLPALGEEVKVYTYLHVKEDALTLYGFLSEAQRQLFQLLLTVSGIGPKGALAIIAGATVEDFLSAVATENLVVLTGLPGIGKKTAQRLVLELKEKVHSIAGEGYIKTGKAEVPSMTHFEEAATALIALGYQPSHVKQVLQRLQKESAENQSVEDLIRYGLRQLTSFRG